MMTLGDFYHKYNVFLNSINGVMVYSHRVSESEVKLATKTDGDYNFPLTEELTITEDGYYIAGFKVTFNLKQIAFTTEKYYQAEVSGGYIPVNALKRGKPK